MGPCFPPVWGLSAPLHVPESLLELSYFVLRTLSPLDPRGRSVSRIPSWKTTSTANIFPAGPDSGRKRMLNF